MPGAAPHACIARLRMTQQACLSAHLSASTHACLLESAASPTARSFGTVAWQGRMSQNMQCQDCLPCASLPGRVQRTQGCGRKNHTHAACLVALGPQTLSLPHLHAYVPCFNLSKLMLAWQRLTKRMRLACLRRALSLTCPSCGRPTMCGLAGSTNLDVSVQTEASTRHSYNALSGGAYTHLSARQRCHCLLLDLGFRGFLRVRGKVISEVI